MLLEKYTNQGFSISEFGAASMALRRFDKPIFVFSTGVSIDSEFVNALCECNLKIGRKKSLPQDQCGELVSALAF